MKQIQSGGNTRIRLIGYDGHSSITMMLATSLNDLVDKGHLVKNSLIKLTGYQLNLVQNTRQVNVGGNIHYIVICTIFLVLYT